MSVDTAPSQVQQVLLLLILGVNLVDLSATERLRAEDQDHEESVQDDDSSYGTVETKLTSRALHQACQSHLGRCGNISLPLRHLITYYNKAKAIRGHCMDPSWPQFSCIRLVSA